MNFEKEDAYTDNGRRGRAASRETASEGARAVRTGPDQEESQDLRARVEEIDKRLAELRATLENRPDGPGDQVDAAATLSLREEIMMMVETLENEKRRLLERPQGR